MLEFSPLRQQNVPPTMNDENVFGENKPTPPRYRIPPRAIIFNSEEAKMLTLICLWLITNECLIEIGIKNEADRKAIFEVINRS